MYFSSIDLLHFEAPHSFLLSTNRFRSVSMVEEHSTYRVLAIATSVGIIVSIISIVAIVFICLYHRYKAANPNKHSMQPKSPIELSHAVKTPSSKNKKMQMITEIHHPALNRATAHPMRPIHQLNKNRPNKLISELDMIKTCPSKKNLPRSKTHPLIISHH